VQARRQVLVDVGGQYKSGGRCQRNPKNSSLLSSARELIAIGGLVTHLPGKSDEDVAGAIKIRN